MARALLLVSFLCTASWLQAQADTPPAATAPRTGFLDETITVAGTEHRYVLYVPADYTKDRSWPLIVFLNGAGECGTDGKKQISVGLAPAIEKAPAAWPFLVLFPQKPDRASAWEDHDPMVMLMLDKARADYAVDEKQLLLTGLSQGGHGTWALGALHADVWAAIAPVCGYGEPRGIARELKNMPIWCFHGEDDKAVPVQQSKDLCAAVEKAGGHAELTLYPGVGHNSWDKAYGESLLAEWLQVVAEDRAHAAYVARPELVNRATLTVRHTWNGGGGNGGGGNGGGGNGDGGDKDAGRPSHGTKAVTLELDDTKVTWRVAIERPRPAAEPRQGQIDLRAGKELLLQRLHALQTAAVLRLPNPVRPASVRGVVKATNEFVLDVALDGPRGTWRFHCDVPKLAEFDARFAPQVRALAAFVSAIEALH